MKPLEGKQANSIKARQLLETGLDAAEKGHLKRARQSFRASVKKHATAEGLTYWGWMEYHLGHTPFAILLCHKAIALDPELGNPYNDIGSYLMCLGKVEESIPWFNKAIKAKRYEPRQYPHINLGRIYLSKDLPRQALAEFQLALEISPGDDEIVQLIDGISRTLH